MIFKSAQRGLFICQRQALYTNPRPVYMGKDNERRKKLDHDKDRRFNKGELLVWWELHKKTNTIKVA